MIICNNCGRSVEKHSHLYFAEKDTKATWFVFCCPDCVPERGSKLYKILTIKREI